MSTTPQPRSILIPTGAARSPRKRKAPVFYEEKESRSDTDEESANTIPQQKGRRKSRSPTKPPPHTPGTPTRKSRSPTKPPPRAPATTRKRKQATPVFRGGGKRRKKHFEEWSDDSEIDGDVENERLPLLLMDRLHVHDAIPKQSLASRSPLKRLPIELVQRVAILLDGKDFVALTATCRHFSTGLHPQNSTIWSRRFLSKYDYPLVSNHNQFCAAYKERSLVLRKSTSYSDVSDPRVAPQLVVLLDMVLEAFYSPQPWKAPPRQSKNLALFQDASSEFMRYFLSTPVIDVSNFSKAKPYGDPHPLFDALQVTLSYLLLSPAYKMAQISFFQRNDYDLARVYNWNAAFGTIYARLPDRRVVVQEASAMFPNMAYKENLVKRFHLDMRTLLHVRNFWHRHMVRDVQARFSNTRTDVEEDSYWRVVEKLSELGHVPKPWTKSLLLAVVSRKNFRSDGPPPARWVGFYSTIRPWPSAGTVKAGLQRLSEVQTNATDWEKNDPLVLDLTYSATNVEKVFLSGSRAAVPYWQVNTAAAGSSSAASGESKEKKTQTGENTTIWPDIFAQIPVFKRTIPGHSVKKGSSKVDEAKETEEQGLGKTWFVRGVGRWMDIDAELTEKRQYENEKRRREKQERELKEKQEREMAEMRDMIIDVSDDDAQKIGVEDSITITRSRSSRARSRSATESAEDVAMTGCDDVEDVNTKGALGNDAAASNNGNNAPSITTANHQDAGAASAPAPPAFLPSTHPFLGPRIRGVIHPIPFFDPSLDLSQPSNTSSSEIDDFFGSSSHYTEPTPLTRELVPPVPIPGFSRLILLLYTPTPLNLIRQLEHSSGNYGNSFGVSINSQLSQTAIQYYQSIVGGGTGGGAGGIAGGNANTTPTTQQINEEVLILFREHLAGLVRGREAEARAGSSTVAGTAASCSSSNEKPAKKQGLKSREIWTPALLKDLELSLSPEGQLNWEDIDYAYAYEGVLTPGGQVMLGRWWRVGEAGLVEVVDEAETDEVDGDQEEQDDAQPHILSVGGELDFAGAGVSDGMEHEKSGYRQPSRGAAEANGAGIGGASEHSNGNGNGKADDASSPGQKSGDGDTEMNMSGSPPKPTATPKPVIQNKNLDRGPFVFWTMNQDT